MLEVSNRHLFPSKDSQNQKKCFLYRKSCLDNILVQEYFTTFIQGQLFTSSHYESLSRQWNNDSGLFGKIASAWSHLERLLEFPSIVDYLVLWIDLKNIFVGHIQVRKIDDEIAKEKKGKFLVGNVWVVDVASNKGNKECFFGREKKGWFFWILHNVQRSKAWASLIPCIDTQLCSRSINYTTGQRSIVGLF